MSELSFECSNQIREFVKGTPTETWGFSTFIRSAAFIVHPETFLVHDTLKIHCEIKIIGDVKKELSNGGMAFSSPSSEERNKRFKDELASDFGKLFKEEIGTDVTILVGKTGLKAHKIVLAGAFLSSSFEL
ncbi:unnamed protein product [Orchesella dallaii]|uniref:MATH domain-containing protein n=1 Tax=Orchesella dallaii TaxID=48710 RepID=A0ABP1R0E1_9HEXA